MALPSIKILGVDIPASKTAWCSLSYIYGIGPTLARKICKEVGVDCNARMNTFSDEKLDSIRKYIEQNYTIEGDLRQEVTRNIKRLIAVKCYKGLRHRLGLPVRGQRTKTNARTRKGKRKSVSSLHKK